VTPKKNKEVDSACEPPKQRPRVESSNSIWDSFDMFANTDDVTSPASPIEIEISSYLSETVIDRQDDPLSWWRANRARFPNLSHCARKLTANGFLAPAAMCVMTSGHAYLQTR
jgi:hypothetical protein